MLTDRRQEVFEAVVADYLQGGRPVGSQSIADRVGAGWSPSTIRAELAALEQAGLLDQPHTSAGRVPTEAGYRLYVERLLDVRAPAPNPAAAEPSFDLGTRREVEAAIRETTEALSQITHLAALATAPPLHTASVHRVEVLALRPRVAVVIVIASNGEVSRRVFEFEENLDQGLVEWAGAYLNERLAGTSLGSSTAASRLLDPDLGDSERWFVGRVQSAFTGLSSEGGERLYVGGADRLVEAGDEVPHAGELVRALETRVTLLETLRSAMEARRVFAWIGEENPQPELRSVSVVGANYGLGHRNLGTVGVIGPLRMDYETAIASVRVAADRLSRAFEDVYEG